MRRAVDGRPLGSGNLPNRRRVLVYTVRAPHRGRRLGQPRGRNRTKSRRDALLLSSTLSLQERVHLLSVRAGGAGVIFQWRLLLRFLQLPTCLISELCWCKFLTISGEQITPIQPHKADSGAARTSPGRSRKRKQCASTQRRTSL